jgi:uncharacterized membrane protein YqiK
MSGMPDWIAWILAALLVVLFGLFFWHTGVALYRSARHLIDTIQNWPQIRRAMVDAEARSGGRYPLWFRAVRVLLVLAMLGFAALLIWRKLAGL